MKKRNIVLCDDGKPEKVLLLCEKYGLGIEVQGFYDPNKVWQKAEIVAMYRQILPKGIETHLHAPFWDLCLGSANKKIAEVTRYYFDYAYGVAEELCCRSVTVHHGYVPNTSWPKNWIARSIGFWEAFFTDKPGNIRINMENLCEHNPDTLIGVVDGCATERLCVNLDIGHAHCISCIPVVDWISRLGSRIGYVHVHQNHGVRDEHLGLLRGNIPMNEVFAALDEHAPDATIALECAVDEMEESLEYLAEMGVLL